jgi:hypothetical protein
MAKQSSDVAPLTFDVREDLFRALEARVSKTDLRSISEAVREALEDYNLSHFSHEATDHRQISVRISTAQKNALKRTSKNRKASVGEILRSALEAYLENPPARPAASASMPAKKTTRKATKKTAHKTAAKKTATKKAAVKKSAAKKSAAKKSPAKKAATKKKVAAKKTATRKSASKKSAVKKTATKKAATKKKVAKKATKKTARKRR